MIMLSHWNVGSAASDLWRYVRQPRPHRWPLLGLSVAITWFILWGFFQFAVRPVKPDTRIIYLESWSADRSDTDVQADWVDRAREATRRNALRRAQYQRLADEMGIAYDSGQADADTAKILGEAEAQAIRAGPGRAPVTSDLAQRAARGAPSAPTAP